SDDRASPVPRAGGELDAGVRLHGRHARQAGLLDGGAGRHRWPGEGGRSGVHAGRRRRRLLPRLGARGAGSVRPVPDRRGGGDGHGRGDPGRRAAHRLSGDTRRVSENLDLVRAIFSRWEEGDFGSAEWADPEIEFAMIGGLTTGEWTGIDAMTEAWAALLKA